MRRKTSKSFDLSRWESPPSTKALKKQKPIKNSGRMEMAALCCVVAVPQHTVTKDPARLPDYFSEKSYS